MRHCRKVRGILAASLYEELEPGERERLDAHLRDCEACREEARALEQLVDRVPAGPVAFSADLGPVLRERLRHGAGTRSVDGIRWPVWGISAAVVAAVASGVIFYGPMSSESPGQMAEVPASAGEVAGPVDGKLNVARDLVEQRRPAEAFRMLEQAVAENPKSETAGEAYLLMANLAYDELKWYPQAYDAYNTLRVEHYDLFRRDEANIQRLNVLDETRGSDNRYAALHALDAARLNEDFESLEEVVSRNPGKYVAALAANEMARIAGEDMDTSDGGGQDKLYAMQAALEQCSNPVARAQLKVEMGHIMKNEMNDRDGAKSLYEEVVSTEHPVLARLAEEALRGLAGQ